MSTGGIFIGQSGIPFRSSNLRFTTKHRHVMSDLKKDPPHLDILTLANATALSLAPPAPGIDFSTTSETLATIPHGLPYTPETLTYYYVESSTSNPGAVGRYYSNWFPILAGGGYYADFLNVVADRTNVYINHTMFHYWDGGSTVVSNADDYVFRVKYYILSIDSGVQTYTTLR